MLEIHHSGREPLKCLQGILCKEISLLCVLTQICELMGKKKQPQNENKKVPWQFFSSKPCGLEFLSKMSVVGRKSNNAVV